jgi:hypothetical protein
MIQCQSAPDITDSEMDAIAAYPTNALTWSMGHTSRPLNRRWLYSAWPCRRRVQRHGGLASGDPAAGVGRRRSDHHPFQLRGSANCILYERARPVFVDIEPKTMNIDPRGSKRRSRANSRHPPGDYSFWPACGPRSHRRDQPALADDHGSKMLQRLWARVRGRKAGTLGDVAVLVSSHKQMTTGEGGILVTDRDEWNVLFRSLRNQGGMRGIWPRHPFGI